MGRLVPHNCSKYTVGSEEKLQTVQKLFIRVWESKFTTDVRVPMGSEERQGEGLRRRHIWVPDREKKTGDCGGQIFFFLVVEEKG